MVSDCLSPTTSLKPGKHHKLSEVDNVDTPPAQPISDPMYASSGGKQVQSTYQQAGLANGQASPKRLRVTPAVSTCLLVIVHIVLDTHTHMHLYGHPPDVPSSSDPSQDAGMHLLMKSSFLGWLD